MKNYFDCVSVEKEINHTSSFGVLIILLDVILFER